MEKPLTKLDIDGELFIPLPPPKKERKSMYKTMVSHLTQKYWTYSIRLPKKKMDLLKALASEI